jgi:hypothetical protein
MMRMYISEPVTSVFTYTYLGQWNVMKPVLLQYVTHISLTWRHFQAVTNASFKEKCQIA